MHHFQIIEHWAHSATVLWLGHVHYFIRWNVRTLQPNPWVCSMYRERAQPRYAKFGVKMDK